MPSLSRGGELRQVSERYFLNSPQSVPDLHRFFTGLQGLPLAGSTFAGAKSKRGSDASDQGAYRSLFNLRRLGMETDKHPWQPPGRTLRLPRKSPPRSF